MQGLRPQPYRVEMPPPPKPPPTVSRERSKEGRSGSKVSAVTDSRRSSISSVGAMSIDDTEAEGVKKRKLEDDSEVRESGALRKMRDISARLRDYLFDPAQLVGREVAKFEQTRMAEMEDVLLEVLMENELLIGMTHAVCDKNLSVNENVNQIMEGTAGYASVTAATRANKYENVKKRHAIVVRPKEGEMTSEKVKEIVLKEIQPKMKETAQVNFSSDDTQWRDSY